MDYKSTFELESISLLLLKANFKEKLTWPREIPRARMPWYLIMTNTAVEGAQHNSPCYIIAIKLLSQSRAQCRQIVCLQKDTEFRFVVPRYIHCTVTLTHQFSTLAHHRQHCPTNTIQQPTKMLDWEIGKCYRETWETVASTQLILKS